MILFCECQALYLVRMIEVDKILHHFVPLLNRLIKLKFKGMSFNLLQSKSVQWQCANVLNGKKMMSSYELSL